MDAESLGLNSNDLGGEDDLDTGDDGDLGDDEPEPRGRRYVEPDDDDEGDDSDLDLGGGRQRGQLDDLSVTHTRGRREQRPFPTSTVEGIRPDQYGNLVDREGNIVARAGKERKLYQKAFKAGEGARAGGLQFKISQQQRQLERAVDIGKRMNDQLKQYKQQADAVKQFNFTPQDQLAAYQMYSEMKKDTKSFLQRVLTRAAASGINVQELGVSGGAGNTKELVDLLREEFKQIAEPLKQRNEQELQREQRQREEDEVNRRVADDTEQFFADNSEARRYLPTFQRLLQNPDTAGMSLGEMWARIQLHLERQGRNGRGRQRQNGRHRGSSRPQGRQFSAPERGEMAPVSSSYGEIITDVLNEMGIR